MGFGLGGIFTGLHQVGGECGTIFFIRNDLGLLSGIVPQIIRIQQDNRGQGFS